MIFYKIYGGGPIIVREKLDIYSKDLTKELPKILASRGKATNVLGKSQAGISQFNRQEE